jgi:predicted transcriptional regulator
VATNVKFHSSQDKTSQSIVTNVFRNTNQKAEEAQDLVEEAQVAEEALAAEVAEDLAAVEALTEDREKCTRRLVETVARNVKFHSNHQETSQSIAANVFKVIEETRIILV